MNQYRCEFSVNGTRTQQYVYAYSTIDAKKLIEYQYANCTITWWGCFNA